MLAVFARRTKAGVGAVPAPNKEVPDLEWAQWYLAEYLICSGGEWASTGATQRTLSKGMDGRWFSTALTRLHQELRKALGPAAANYCVHDGGKKPRSYSLQLDAAAIQFIK
jgi:hypothetical protein